MYFIGTVRVVHDYSLVGLIWCHYRCVFVGSPALPVASMTGMPLTLHEHANHDRICHVYIISLLACSALFCHLSHICHSSPVLSIHIIRFCQPHHFCQLLSTQSSPVLSTISTTYVATDEVTTCVNKARPPLSTVLVFPIDLRVLCSVTI